MSSTCCVAHKGFYKPNSRIEFEAEVAAQRFQESTAGGSVDIKKKPHRNWAGVSVSQCKYQR